MTRDERLGAFVRAYLRTPDAQWRVSRRPLRAGIEWRFEVHPGRHMLQAWKMVSWGASETEATERAEDYFRPLVELWRAAADAAGEPPP